MGASGVCSFPYIKISTSFFATMASPLVSVIVPNYNYARYLPERLESVFNQTFQDFEVIILDDCSTDDSREVIDRYRNHPKVSAIVFNEENSGSPFKQWFKGLEMAKGELIWIAEADDSALPVFLGKMAEALQANPSAALAISGTRVIDENGRPSVQTFDRWDRGEEQGVGVSKLYDGKRYLIHNMYWACYVYNASCVVFRKDAFLEDDYSRSLTMRNAGDWLFWSRMLCHGDIVEVREKLSFLRRHSESVTFVGNKNGNLLKEDAVVVNAIEGMVNVGRYRKMIRHGEMLKRVARMGLPPEQKRQYRDEVKNVLGASDFEYLVERVNKPFTKYFPFLITSAKDLI